MSLDRNHLREELAAIIAASRELPPDHDRALADIFLERAQLGIQQPAPVAARPQHDWPLLAGALLLAMTAFLFGTVFGRIGSHGPPYGYRGYFDGMHHQGGYFYNQGQSLPNTVFPPFQQAPQSPSQSQPAL